MVVAEMVVVELVADMIVVAELAVVVAVVAVDFPAMKTPPLILFEYRIKSADQISYSYII